jgi:hypothetical protein
MLEMTRVEKNKVVAGVVVLFAISGCAVNGFEKYYSPEPGSEGARTDPWIEKPTPEPKVYAYSDDPKSDTQRAAEEGYLTIGVSSFNGPPATMTRAQLMAQAKKIGASMVLVHSQYKDTISGLVRYDVANPPQVSTVNTTGTVNGQSPITTPGGKTTFATFWVRQDVSKLRLGVDIAPLPDSVRTKLQRNTGVITAVVIRGTPAFNANVLRGDVILKVGGEDVIDPQSFTDLLTKFARQTVDLELLRGDTPKTIRVTLGPRS